MTTHATAHSDDTSKRGETKSFTRFLPPIARILLGLVFFGAGFFGLLIAFGLMAVPAPKGDQAAGVTAFFELMMKSGYLLALVKATETIAGALLLSNRFVPLALTILAPVLVNIIPFHAFLSPAGLALPLVLLVLEVYLAWSYRDVFRPILAARATASAR